MRVALYRGLESMASITSHPETSDKGSQIPWLHVVVRCTAKQSLAMSYEWNTIRSKLSNRWS